MYRLNRLFQRVSSLANAIGFLREFARTSLFLFLFLFLVLLVRRFDKVSSIIFYHGN